MAAVKRAITATARKVDLKNPNLLITVFWNPFMISSPPCRNPPACQCCPIPGTMTFL